MQLAEDPALGEDPRVALGHLPAQDRLDPGRVRLVLAAREGEHAGAAVLDGDRGVEQRRDGVGDRKEVAGGQSAQGLRLGGADVVLREQGAQHGSQVRPRRTPAEPEQRDARRLRRCADRGGHRYRCTDDERGGVGPTQLAEQRRHLLGIVEPDAQHECLVRQHRHVDGIVDHHTADLVDCLRVALDEVQQGGAQVVQDTAEAGARLGAAGGHGRIDSQTVGDAPEPTSVTPCALRPEAHGCFKRGGGRALRSAGRSAARPPRRG